MATETTNYGFNKDEANEYYNIEKINKTLDDIDAQIYGNSLVIDPYAINLVSNKAVNWHQGYIGASNNAGSPYGSLIPDKTTDKNQTSSECNITSGFFDVDPTKQYLINADTTHFSFDIYYQIVYYDKNNSYIGFANAENGYRFIRSVPITGLTYDLPDNAAKARLTMYRKEIYGEANPYTPISHAQIEGYDIKLEAVEKSEEAQEPTLFTLSLEDIGGVDFEQIIVGSEPKDPIVGTLWIDTRSTENVIFYYDGAYWEPVALYESTDVAKQAKDNREAIKAHSAENVMQVLNITRDLQIAGIQAISFSKKVKGLLAFGTANGSNKFTLGGLGADGISSVMSMIESTSKYINYTNSRPIIFMQSPTVFTEGKVTINDNDVNINWILGNTGAIGIGNVCLIAFF